MSLRNRTLLMIGITLIVLTLTLQGISSLILQNSFSNLEMLQARQNVQRVLSAIQYDVNGLAFSAHDWAAWDDTYAFVEDLNAAYRESNLIDSTFDSTRLNIMLYFNTHDEMVWGQAYDLEEQDAVPLPEALPAHLNDAGLLAPTRSSAEVAGLVMLDGRPMLVAAQPILTSENDGPTHGTLVMGRFICTDVVESLAARTLLSLTLDPVDTLAPQFQAELFASDMLIHIENERAITGYGLVRDIYGAPALAARVQIPRDVYQQGQRTTRYFIWMLVASGIVFGVVILLILGRVVLNRLENLSHTVSHIGSSGDLSVRANTSGNDEISQLAETVNYMLAALEEAQYAREHAALQLREYTQELEARNVELDAFAHTVAHDLKSPLTAIVGFSSILEKRLNQTTPQESEYYLQIITQNGRKMANIIDELLLFATVRKLNEVDVHPLNMTNLINDALHRMVDLIEERKAEFSYPETWPIVYGHGPWVEEVWANYISNAVKYGGNPPRVEMGAELLPAHAEPGVEQGVMVRFWVRDNGMGLKPDEQARLFTLFTRLEQTRAKGHGLGLSIVLRIVQKMGGQVGVESTYGQGSTFWFTLAAENHAIVLPDVSDSQP